MNTLNSRLQIFGVRDPYVPPPNLVQLTTVAATALLQSDSVVPGQTYKIGPITQGDLVDYYVYTTGLDISAFAPAVSVETAMYTMLLPGLFSYTNFKLQELTTRYQNHLIGQYSIDYFHSYNDSNVRNNRIKRTTITKTGGSVYDSTFENSSVKISAGRIYESTIRGTFYEHFSTGSTYRARIIAATVRLHGNGSFSQTSFRNMVMYNSCAIVFRYSDISSCIFSFTNTVGLIEKVAFSGGYFKLEECPDIRIQYSSFTTALHQVGFLSKAVFYRARIENLILSSDLTAAADDVIEIYYSDFNYATVKSVDSSVARIFYSGISGNSFISATNSTPTFSRLTMASNSYFTVIDTPHTDFYYNSLNERAQVTLTNCQKFRLRHNNFRSCVVQLSNSSPDLDYFNLEGCSITNYARVTADTHGFRLYAVNVSGRSELSVSGTGLLTHFSYYTDVKNYSYLKMIGDFSARVHYCNFTNRSNITTNPTGDTNFAFLNTMRLTTTLTATTNGTAQQNF